MRIAVAIKIVPDDQDIAVADDGTLDYSKAKPVVSAYDLNALEVAAQLAVANEGSTVVAVSVGDASLDNSKLKKNILSRGVDELFIRAKDAFANLDTFATATELAKLVGEIGGYDVIICGDGSADVYAQQTDVQLAAALDLPCVTAVSRIESAEGLFICDRLLESAVETVKVPAPCVVSVVPDAAQPRIPGMKDILAAGKKPSQVIAADECAVSSIEVVEEKAPDQAKRKLEIYEDLDEFVAVVKAAV